MPLSPYTLTHTQMLKPKKYSQWNVDTRTYTSFCIYKPAKLKEKEKKNRNMYQYITPSPYT